MFLVPQTTTGKIEPAIKPPDQRQPDKSACSDCDNPHGSGTEADLDKVSLNESCLSCHNEKRDPYLFEHPPVAENCSECHVPHRSARPSLLLSRLAHNVIKKPDEK